MALRALGTDAPYTFYYVLSVRTTTWFAKPHDLTTQQRTRGVLHPFARLPLQARSDPFSPLRPEDEAKTRDLLGKFHELFKVSPQVHYNARTRTGC